MSLSQRIRFVKLLKHPLRESLFEYASALGAVGLSVGVMGAQTPPLVLWTQATGMFLGRLEFFVVLVSAAKVVRDFFFMLTARSRR
jgi:trk system potassium uptake protein TrkH